MPVTNSPPSPTAPTTLAPGTVLTLPPILANIPTPQGGFAVCQVCTEGYFVKDKNAEVTYAGHTFACREIEALGFQRGIPDLFCDKSLTSAILEACGCDEIFYSEAPSSTAQAATPTPITPTMIASAGPTIRITSSMPDTNSPPSPTAPTTLAPGTVLTLPPILANIPTPQGGFAVCQVCTEGYFVKDKNAEVTYAGHTFTCREIEALGFQRGIPDLFCDKSLTSAILEACGCDEIFYSEAPSSMSQTPTLAPTKLTTVDARSSTPTLAPTELAGVEAPSSTPQGATLAPNKSAGFTMSGITIGSVLATTACSLLTLVGLSI
jgi:hypothetical protein